MHEVIRGIAENNVWLTGGKKLFAMWSKTKGEREVASHASWVKRSVLRVAPDCVETLDLEYTSRSAWMGSSFVA